MKIIPMYFHNSKLRYEIFNEEVSEEIVGHAYIGNIIIYDCSRELSSEREKCIFLATNDFISPLLLKKIKRYFQERIPSNLTLRYLGDYLIFAAIRYNDFNPNILSDLENIILGKTQIGEAGDFRKYPTRYKYIVIRKKDKNIAFYATFCRERLMNACLSKDIRDKEIKIQNEDELQNGFYFAYPHDISKKKLKNIQSLFNSLGYKIELKIVPIVSTYGFYNIIFKLPENMLNDFLAIGLLATLLKYKNRLPEDLTKEGVLDLFNIGVIDYPYKLYFLYFKYGYEKLCEMLSEKNKDFAIFYENQKKDNCSSLPVINGRVITGPIKLNTFFWDYIYEMYEKEVI